MSVSLRLRTVMKAQGVDSKELGRRIYGAEDTHAKSRVHEWATGVHAPSRQSREKLAAALRIPVEVFTAP